MRAPTNETNSTRTIVNAQRGALRMSYNNGSLNTQRMVRGTAASYGQECVAIAITMSGKHSYLRNSGGNSPTRPMILAITCSRSARTITDPLAVGAGARRILSL